MGKVLRFKDGSRVLLALAAVCCLTTARSQQPGDLHLVQAVVDGLRSPRHAWQADSILRLQHGVVVSRTDHNTRNLMMHLQPGCSLQRAEVEALLLPLGMSLRCWRRAPITPERFEHLDPRTCGQPIMQR